MALCISDSNNPSYNTKLSTASGFYRSEAQNLGNAGTSALTTGSPYVAFGLTFANAGKSQGVVLGIYATSVTINRDLNVRLQETKGTVTFNTTTETFTCAGHGLSNGNSVAFTSTGTLPTGIVSNGIYYVISAAADTFQVSLTRGGAVQPLSGTPSGTATLWASRGLKTQTPSQLFGTFTLGGYAGYNYVEGFVPFKWDKDGLGNDLVGGYTIDTTAAKWRIHCVQTGGSVGTWYIVTSDGTNPFYSAWCDNKISFTNGDQLGVVDKCIVDKTATITGVLGTGDLVWQTAGFVCRNSDYSIDNVALLEWENPAAAPYTLTINGQMWLGTHSAFRAGTELAPIAKSNMGTIIAGVTLGTNTTGGFRSSQGSASSSSYVQDRSSFFIYGAKDAHPITTLSQNANTGQAIINTTDDMSAWWTAGDQLAIGKCDVAAQGDMAYYTIQSISGNQITLTGNLAVNNRIAGGHVFRLNGNGFKLQGISNTNYTYNYIVNPSNYHVEGCLLQDATLYVGSGSYYYAVDDDAYTSEYVIQDNIGYYTGNTIVYMCNQLFTPKKGATLQRNYGLRSCFVSGVSGYQNAFIKSGWTKVYDNVSLANYTSAHWNPVASSSPKIDAQRNYMENSGRYGGVLGGLNVIFKDNHFWGCSASYGSGYYTLNIGQLINPVEISGNTFDKCGVALRISANNTMKAIDKNCVFGGTAANTYDIVVDPGAIIDYELNNTLGITTTDFAGMSDSILGSQLKFTNYNQTPLDDRVLTTYGNYQREATIVRTGGADRFSLRFEPTDSVNKLSWLQKIPTGNIQNRTMGVTAWVKIANATYYAGTHVNPTLRVKFDDSTEVTGVATNTTEWQQLSVFFTPTTTFGQIEVSVEGATDALTTNAYFYLDDMGVNYPDGVAVDLGGLDLWANALPITPTIATVPSLGNVSLEDLNAKLDTLLTEDTFVALSD